jgi:uncharacterized membrane protein
MTGKRAFGWLVKYYPIVANINLLALMIFQFLGISSNGITGYIVGCVVWPTIILIFLSKYLHFCAWHRVLLYNLIFYAVVSVLAKYVEFDYYFYVALTANVFAIMASAILYTRDGCYNRNKI